MADRFLLYSPGERFKRVGVTEGPMKTTKAALGILAIKMAIVGRVFALWILPLLLLLALPAVVQAQFAYELTNNTLTITGYTGPGGAVVIQSEVNGVPVTRIGDEAFFGCTSLTEITIPNSVTGIGPSAFASCTRLAAVTIGNHVSNIEDSAFANCTSLTKITIPSSVSSIGSGAFALCTSLTNAYFESNAPAVDLSMFSDDNYLTFYYLPGTTGWGPFFDNCPAVLWNAADWTWEL